MRTLIQESNLPVARSGTSITLRDIVFILYRRRWIMLAISLPIMLVSAFGLTRRTGTYTATSRVVVELIKVDLPTWNTQGRSVEYDRELSTLFNIAMSLPVIERAAVALRDSIPVMQSLDPTLVHLAEPDGLKDFLSGGIDVSVVGESAILEFSFTSANPRISLMASGAMRDAFVEYQVYGRKNKAAIAYYDEQVANTNGEIDSLLIKRSKVMKDSGYTSLTDEMRHESGRLADLESDLSSTIVGRRTLEAQLAMLEDYLKGDPRDFPMGQDENKLTTLISLRNSVAERDEALSDARVAHTENSVAVRRAREVLDDALAALKREQRNIVESVRFSLQAAREREASLVDEITKIRKESSTSPDVYQRVTLLDAEISSLRHLLTDLQTKRGEVRLSQMADERVSSVTVLADPELSTIISGSKTVVYLFVLCLFALALGVVVAFIVENLDHRIYSPKDVEDNLKLPVFASISKVD